MLGVFFWKFFIFAQAYLCSDLSEIEKQPCYQLWSEFRLSKHSPDIHETSRKLQVSFWLLSYLEDFPRASYYLPELHFPYGGARDAKSKWSCYGIKLKKRTSHAQTEPGAYSGDKIMIMIMKNSFCVRHSVYHFTCMTSFDGIHCYK